MKLDPGLTMDQHVRSIVSTCNYHLQAFRHIRPLLDQKVAESVGRSIVMSRLDYCNALLAGTTKNNLNLLQKVQNQCIRTVCQLPYRASTTSPRLDLHWLPVKERVNYKLSVITYKTMSTNQPTYLRNLLTEYVPARTLRSSIDDKKLVVPLTRSKLQERSFSFAAPSCWNSLPLFIRQSPTLQSFKSSLKRFLFSSSTSS